MLIVIARTFVTLHEQGTSYFAGKKSSSFKVNLVNNKKITNLALLFANIHKCGTVNFAEKVILAEVDTIANIRIVCLPKVQTSTVCLNEKVRFSSFLTCDSNTNKHITLTVRYNSSLTDSGFSEILFVND